MEALQDPADRHAIDRMALNRALEGAPAEGVIAWAAEHFAEGLVLSTSFGIQAAVMLHLATRVIPDLPVIWVDTGYLPAETYRFAEQLRERLALNLHVVQSPLSPARMEALYGRLWEHDDAEAVQLYDRIRKVEPMQRALDALSATAWLSGLRADQTDYRRTLPVLGRQGRRLKILPILRWSAKDVQDYLKAHDLPYHPLFEQGYATVGDWHSSRPLSANDEHERDTRFGGFKQECGLHLPDADKAKMSSASALH